MEIAFRLTCDAIPSWWSCRVQWRGCPGNIVLYPRCCHGYTRSPRRRWRVRLSRWSGSGVDAARTMNATYRWSWRRMRIHTSSSSWMPGRPSMPWPTRLVDVDGIVTTFLLATHLVIDKLFNTCYSEVGISDWSDCCSWVRWALLVGCPPYNGCYVIWATHGVV